MSAPTQFSSRSDYGSFIAVGIPAGGLFSGAEGIKTEEEAAVYGGEAGVAYDACYHQARDTINNLNTDALSEMSDAAADATLTLAWPARAAGCSATAGSAAPGRGVAPRRPSTTRTVTPPAEYELPPR